MRLYDDKLRTETFGHLYGLCRMNTKTTCLIAGRRHHATLCVVSYSYRFTFQFWIVTLFYSRKELVHVNMNNLHFISFSSRKRSSASSISSLGIGQPALRAISKGRV